MNKENKSETMKSGRKKWGMIGAVAVVLIAMIVGISIYNSPENRLSRLLELGNRYLEEQNYEQAAITFDKAITIDDRCMEAYEGGIKAYLGLDDRDGLASFYERAFEAVKKLGESELAESMEIVVSIYLSVDYAYIDKPEKTIEILEEGLELTENERIKEKLIEDYLELAKNYANKEEYDKALEIYDRLLELDGENDKVQSDIGDCLQKYLNLLMEQKRYDEIRTLIEKYRNIVKTVDFQYYLEKIADLEEIEEESRAFMQKIYDLMAAEDYEAMHEVDGSEEAIVFIEGMDGNSHIFIPAGDSSQTGKGAGIYRYGEDGYYFYYGDFTGGNREGTGVIFMNISNGGYQLFSGQWQGDVPDGQGELRINYRAFENSGSGYSKVERGNLNNGLWDGLVNAQIFSDGNAYDVSFTAIEGIIQEDKTEEFFSIYGSVANLEEGFKIYAFDDSGYNCVWVSCKQGATYGVTDFADFVA